MAWLKQRGANIPIDRRHLYKVCGFVAQPPGNSSLVPDTNSVAEACYLPALRMYPWMNHHLSTSLPLQMTKIWVIFSFAFSIIRKNKKNKSGVKSPNPKTYDKRKNINKFFHFRDLKQRIFGIITQKWLAIVEVEFYVDRLVVFHSNSDTGQLDEIWKALMFSHKTKQTNKAGESNLPGIIAESTTVQEVFSTSKTHCFVHNIQDLFRCGGC